MLNVQPKLREDSPMYRLPRGIHRGKLSHDLYKLKVGDELFKAVATNKDYSVLCDRIAMSLQTKALEGYGMQHDLYACENAANPIEQTLVARIRRIR